MELQESQLETLVQIYNNLLLVNTCGENSFIMTDCMRAFKQIILELQSSKGKEKSHV